MATLIENNFDTFKLADIDGQRETTIQVPHSLAAFLRRIASNENEVSKVYHSHRITNHVNGSKVTTIKYLREFFKDSNGGLLGLKDAKDIADHYYATCAQV